MQSLEEVIIERNSQLLVIDSIAVFARAEFGHNSTAERQVALGRAPRTPGQPAITLT